MPAKAKSAHAFDAQSWIRHLPKAELHLHLEGTIAPETLAELSRQNDAEPLTLDAARALYQYKDFTGFMLAFKAITERLRTPDDYELITYRMIEALAAQGVVHAEVYVSVGVVYYWRRIEFEPLLEGMERGRIRGEKEFGVSVYWIFDAVRHFGPEEAARVFHKAAELKQLHPSIIGIGIGGDERRTGAEPFRELYAEAKKNGLHLTAHAGETVGTGGDLVGSQYRRRTHWPCAFSWTGSRAHRSAGHQAGAGGDLRHQQSAHGMLCTP